MRCFLCDAEFSSNRGGQLTTHVRRAHGLSIEDYVVQRDYNGEPPECACNLCGDRPLFTRGRFSRYAKGHQEFAVRERLYRLRYGDPTCEVCGDATPFSRGVPNRFCSRRCAGRSFGFSDSAVQLKIAESVRAKYGVENVSQLQHVREAIGAKARQRKHRPMSTDARDKIRVHVRQRWGDPEYKVRVSQAIRAGTNTDKERERRRLAQEAAWQDPDYRCARLKQQYPNKLSGLHRQLRAFLGLEEKGFKSEQVVEGYCADELHEAKKLIVEINGDYPHANPKLYAAEDVIRLPGQAYTAKEKWESDQRRRDRLEQSGYRMIVVWESDDLEQKRAEIESALKP